MKTKILILIFATSLLTACSGPSSSEPTSFSAAENQLSSGEVYAFHMRSQNTWLTVSINGSAYEYRPYSTVDNSFKRLSGTISIDGNKATVTDYGNSCYESITTTLTIEEMNVNQVVIEFTRGSLGPLPFERFESYEAFEAHAGLGGATDKSDFCL